MLAAVEHANRLLDWHENLTSEEIPPRWMWHVEHELEDWFEQVEQDRRNRFQSGGDSDDSSEQMVNNDFAKERR